MNIFHKKIKQAKYPLTPAEPTHRAWTIYDELKDLWIGNNAAIGLLIISICIIILLSMMGYAFANGHLHVLSTESNVYEHLDQIVTTGGVILWH
ncbi:MAG: hypothetical protein IJP99_07405 [Methanobrevibacter sp.]|nr:hypothetical protein [Methanobrevibacter sp.]